jgi:hypothetical protein
MRQARREEAGLPFLTGYFVNFTLDVFLQV